VLILILLVSIVVWRAADGGGYVPVQLAISSQMFTQGLEQCRGLTAHTVAKQGARTSNPRTWTNQVPVLLKGGIVWDPIDGRTRTDVLIQNGVIAALNATHVIPNNTRVIKVHGAIITPGLVDMHSHMGVYSWPTFDGNSDGNELTSPTTPQMRTLDGFDPNDLAVKTVMSGGVTTILVLPGSANLMGGEAYAFKLRPGQRGTAEEMLVNHGLPQGEGWRWMKMACGENPKRFYGTQGNHVCI
jgi:imidazolonepropionase-like amidohydrolase